jgi:hypothetical protein
MSEAKVSQPYKTTGKTIVLYILMLEILDKIREDIKVLN